MLGTLGKPVSVLEEGAWSMESLGSVLRDLLSRRDPHGYYVIPVDIEKLDAVLERGRRDGVKIVYLNEIALVKTRSRGLAERIARTAARLGALVVE
ncbi:MAG: hypothetical protein GSR73_00680 [Desulfurococcales archaeon]|nr:hypothetical protein [Desulfurococcales archaeon]